MSALRLPGAPVIRASRPPPTCARTSRGSILMCRGGAGSAASCAKSYQHAFGPPCCAPAPPSAGHAASSSPKSGRCTWAETAELLETRAGLPEHRPGSPEGNAMSFCLQEGSAGDGPKPERCRGCGGSGAHFGRCEGDIVEVGLEQVCGAASPVLLTGRRKADAPKTGVINAECAGE